MRTNHRILILIRNAAGQSMVDLAISTAVVGILLLGAFEALSYFQSSNRFSMTLVTRDQVLALVRQTAGEMKSLRMTTGKPENILMKQCVCGGGCTSSQQKPITLYDSSGSPQSPKYFNSSGSSCDPATPGCFIKISTNFRAQCAPPSMPSGTLLPPLNCNTPAEFVDVIYTVEQNPPTIGSKAPLFKLVRGTVTTLVADINSIGSGVCP